MVLTGVPGLIWEILQNHLFDLWWGPEQMKINWCFIDHRGHDSIPFHFMWNRISPKHNFVFFFSWVAGRHPGIQTQSTVLPLYWNIMVCYQCLLIAWYHFRRSKALIVSSNTSFLFETFMWKRHLSGPSLAGREIRDSSLTLPVGQKLHQEIFNLAKPERKANQHPMAHQIPMMNSYVPIYNIYIYILILMHQLQKIGSRCSTHKLKTHYSGLARRFPTQLTHGCLITNRLSDWLKGVHSCDLVIWGSRVHQSHLASSHPSGL